MMPRVTVDIPAAAVDQATKDELNKAKRKIQKLEREVGELNRRRNVEAEMVRAAKALREAFRSGEYDVLTEPYYEDE